MSGSGSMKARIGGGIQRLRGDDSPDSDADVADSDVADSDVADSDVIVTDVDDDPDAEPLPPPAVAADDPETDEELARLDATG